MRRAVGDSKPDQGGRRRISRIGPQQWNRHAQFCPIGGLGQAFRCAGADGDEKGNGRLVDIGQPHQAVAARLDQAGAPQGRARDQPRPFPADRRDVVRYQHGAAVDQLKPEAGLAGAACAGQHDAAPVDGDAGGMKRGFLPLTAGGGGSGGCFGTVLSSPAECHGRVPERSWRRKRLHGVFRAQRGQVAALYRSGVLA